MMRAATSTVVLASLLVPACARHGSAGLSPGGLSPSLAGTRWILLSMGSEPTPGATAVTLNFETDGRISGSDGCNQYGGTYAADGRSLQLGREIAGTIASCPGPIERQADAYREVLRRTQRFALDGARLNLKDGSDSTLASFEPAATSPVGPTWDVIAYNNGKQAVVSLIIGTVATASFGNDGRVTGSAGCNQYFAPYTLDGESLRISAPSATRRFCGDPERLMEQEGLYLAALQSAATFRLEGDRLELRTASGALAVTLNRRPY